MSILRAMLWGVGITGGIAAGACFLTLLGYLVKSAYNYLVPSVISDGVFTLGCLAVVIFVWSSLMAWVIGNRWL